MFALTALAATRALVSTIETCNVLVPTPLWLEQGARFKLLVPPYIAGYAQETGREDKYLNGQAVEQ